MSPSVRIAAISAALAITVTFAVGAMVLASGRPGLLVNAASTTSSSTIQSAILTSGDAIVSRKPDLAVVDAGVQSQQGTASAAQSDLAAKTAKLVARLKSLGVADKDMNTAGYWVGPVYGPSGETITGYRASEQLHIKWHNVDTVGKTLDAIVQEGGATNISVSFGIADPKSAQAEARTLAIADARSKAQAMASAAGVKLGQVIRVSDLSANSRPPTPYLAATGAVAATPTQVPVGQMDVQVTVEVDFAIG
ncbi:MAG: DUF541 domain-containing protein [Chloroflexi bacterium]|nr:MAG: DUF541 domain-containing protein [Chloroflexota bacterium]TMF36803.1 MAG: DUF541 domain-containing protein [Chloroflexota bacterium]